MTRPQGAVVGSLNSKIRAANGTATASVTATAILWLKPNGDGKENGLRNGATATEKTTLNQVHSGPNNREHLRC